MPASDFSWPSIPRAPIFQVYGTKRRASSSSAECAQTNQETSELSGSCKRVCVRASPQPCAGQSSMCVRAGPQTFASQSSMPIPEINHNCLQQGAFDLQQQQLIQAQSYPHFECSTPVTSQPQSGATCDLFNSNPESRREQPVMLMDLNEETYSSHVPDELGAANMDADCGPDPAQYTPRQRPPVEDACRSEFHEVYCGVGDRSPTSGRVRCYCKPSWEGMMDMRPYISDVY